MNDDPIDHLLRETAMRDRSVEIPDGLAQEIASRATTSRPHRRWYRRRLAIALGILALAGSATAVAVPDTRDALSHAFHAFGDFFTRHGDAPGSPVITDSQSVAPWLNGLDDDVSHPSVIAKNGGARLIGYRQPSTGQACIAIEDVLSMCRPDGEWRTEIRNATIVDLGPVPLNLHSDDMVTYGLVDDTVAAVAVRSANRELVRARPVNNGYVLVVDTKKGPRNVVAYDRTGRALKVVRYAPEYWRIVR